MVHALCKQYSPPLLSLEPPVPDSDSTAKDVTYHPFPAPSTLATPEVAIKLRSLGFGYRADFIQRTANMLVDEHSAASMDTSVHCSIEAPERWLMSLRDLDTTKAREELLRFVGVGRKVADCILLMSLNKVVSAFQRAKPLMLTSIAQREVIPVDTHVHQIAMKHYGFRSIGSSKKVTMTPRLYDEINTKLADTWGEHAGWAHSVRSQHHLHTLELIRKAGSFHRRSEGFLVLRNASISFHLDRRYAKFYPNSNSVKQ